MRRSFLGAFLGSLLQPIITRVGTKFGGYLLLALLGVLVLAVQWFRAQPLWAQVLIGAFAAVVVLSRFAPSRPARPAVVERRPLDDQVTFLYRWFDEDDRLLYVGISNDLARRTGQHMDDKPWMVDAVRCTAESHPNRREALEAEQHAIYSEDPLHNVVHNRGPLW